MVKELIDFRLIESGSPQFPVELSEKKCEKVIHDEKFVARKRELYIGRDNVDVVILSDSIRHEKLLSHPGRILLS